MGLLCDWCEKGLRIVVVTQQIDLSGPVGRMIAAVLLGLAEIELDSGPRGKRWESKSQRRNVSRAGRRAPTRPSPTGKGITGNWSTSCRDSDGTWNEQANGRAVFEGRVKQSSPTIRPIDIAAIFGQSFLPFLKSCVAFVEGHPA